MVVFGWMMVVGMIILSKGMSEYSYKEVNLFIQEELSQHGEWLVDRFADAIEKAKLIDTGQLLDSLDYHTSQDHQGNFSLGISFMTYGRMIEVMARKRKKRLSDQSNHDVWKTKNHRPKKVQWYNKNRYGGYGRLVRRLTAGMSDDELKRIQGILSQAKAEYAAK